MSNNENSNAVPGLLAIIFVIGTSAGFFLGYTWDNLQTVNGKTSYKAVAPLAHR